HRSGKDHDGRRDPRRDGGERLEGRQGGWRYRRGGRHPGHPRINEDGDPGGRRVRRHRRTDRGERGRRGARGRPHRGGRVSELSGIHIRRATEDDYAAIGRLSVAAYRADGQLTAGGGNYGKVLADVASRAEAGELLVATDASGQARGSVLFVLPGSHYAELSRPGEAEFRMLAVDPAAQGRGVGQALVEACIDRARAHGASAIVICVRDFSKPAQRLYARLGFRRVPEL